VTECGVKGSSRDLERNLPEVIEVGVEWFGQMMPKGIMSHEALGIAGNGQGVRGIKVGMLEKAKIGLPFLLSRWVPGF